MDENPYIHAGQTPEERARAAQAMAERRWQGTTPQERSAEMRAVAARRKYTPPDPAKPRCACGAMTLARAQARADRHGKGLGHAPGCPFYRRQRHRGKRRG